LRTLEAWLLLEVKPFLLGAKAKKQLNEVGGLIHWPHKKYFSKEGEAFR